MRIWHKLWVKILTVLRGSMMRGPHSRIIMLLWRHYIVILWMLWKSVVKSHGFIMLRIVIDHFRPLRPFISVVSTSSSERFIFSYFIAKVIVHKFVQLMFL
jgi:hypothetical protein